MLSNVSMTTIEYDDGYKREVPDHVSWRVRDAWLAIPPCYGDHPYCHVDCPYFYECNPPEDDY